MCDYSEFKQNRRKAAEVLKKAKEVNKNKTVRVVIDDRTAVYITPEQYANKKFMERFWKRYAKK